MTIVLSTYVDLSQRCSKATFLQRLIKVDSDPPNDAFFMISLHILHKALDPRKAKIANQLSILISDRIIYHGPFK